MTFSRNCPKSTPKRRKPFSIATISHWIFDEVDAGFFCRVSVSQIWTPPIFFTGFSAAKVLAFLTKNRAASFRLVNSAAKIGPDDLAAQPPPALISRENSLPDKNAPFHFRRNRHRCQILQTRLRGRRSGKNKTCTANPSTKSCKNNPVTKKKNLVNL